MQSNNALVYLRPVKLVYVRAFGAYEQSIGQAWERMFDWLDSARLPRGGGSRYGLARDNPSNVAPDACRYDACVEIPVHMEERAERDLGMMTLPPGPYARTRYRGAYEPLQQTVACLHRDIDLPRQFNLDDRRPIVTIYLDDGQQADKSDLRADICVPVVTMALRPRTSAAAVAKAGL